MARLVLFAAFVFLATAVRASSSVSTFEAAREAITQDGRWPSRCQLDGVVAHSPVHLGDAVRVDVDVSTSACEVGSFRGLVTLHVPAEIAPPMARGDRLHAVAQLAPVYRFWNDGDPGPAAARRGVLLTGGAADVVVAESGAGITHAIDHLREHLRRRIAATFPVETEGMARALVLGEGDLSSDDQRAFRRSGLSHLLAVSGMHLVLVVASFVAGLRALLVRIPALAVRIDVQRLAAAVGLPAAWFYADLAGGSGSAIRAAWMTSVGLFALVVGRRPDTPRALGISIVGMALFDPLVAFDLSFVLSAAATGGLLALGRPIDAWLSARLPSWTSFLVKPTAATTAASMACAPVIACMSPDLPLAGLVANLVAVPLGEAAALPICLVHAMLAPLPLAERGAALAGAGALSLVRAIARWFGALAWGSLPVPTPTAGELAALAVAAFALSLVGRPRRFVMVASTFVLVALEIRTRLEGAPTGLLRVTFIDVGQGDAALVDFPDGRAMLVDAGGFVGSPVDTGERVIAPVLRARRRSEVAVAVLSHPHPDHFGGLRTGLASVRVGELWDTGQGEAEGAHGGYEELLASMRAHAVPIVRPDRLCGEHAFGGATVEVLAPCPGLVVDRGANDNSFVLRIRYGARAILLVGDAEHDAEHDLVASLGSRLHADVLKVGHHGSRTSSTPAFLSAVSPRAAVISCGVRNRFGHPNPRTLLNLAHAGPAIYRTDRDGAVVVTTDGASLDVQALSTMPMYGRFRYFSAKSSP